MGRKLEFPEKFLWGAASASHQNEGNNDNNDFWAWEQIPGHIVDNSTSGLACNWWNNAEQDFDRAAQIGLNTLRMSVEWSRIEPTPGNWNQAAFDRYREMLKASHDRNITPMVTLHHFTNPLWLAERGGWTNPKVVEYFGSYVAKVVDKLQDLCDIWCTINEPCVYATHAYLFGKWSPGARSAGKFRVVSKNQLDAHIRAYHLIRKIQPQAEVGIAKHIAAFAAANPQSRASKWTAATHDTLFNWRFIDALTYGRLRYPLTFLPRNYPQGRDCYDYTGLNYYGRHLLKFSPVNPGGLFGRPVDAAKEIAWPPPWTDREMYAPGIYQILKRLSTYKNKIYITENGLADAEGIVRPAFLLTHLAAVHQAIREGVNVSGYYYWTFVDNYEWVEGWTTRFGLIAIDPETQERTLRPSCDLYRDIIKDNGIREEVVEQYAPQVMEQVFAHL